MGFFKNNSVLLVMVPSIIGIHYGWMWLQGLDSLNKGNTKPLTEQPIVSVNKNIFFYLICY